MKRNNKKYREIQNKTDKNKLRRNKKKQEEIRRTKKRGREES